jgi:glycosyltransferase involved in cell wall biosynthesis
VTETYPPEINGVAHTVHRAVTWLAQRGHLLQVVRPRQATDGASSERCAHPSGLTETLTSGMPIPMYRDLRMGLALPGSLARMWRRTRPELVHIATEGPLGWAALRAARRLRIPTSSDFRTNFHLYSAHYGLRVAQPLALTYLRWFHNCTALTMVPTRTMHEQLAGAGFRNLAVVGRGVDTQLFAPARRSEALRRAWGARPGDLVVLYVGRLAPEKNVGLVLRAFAVLRKAHPAARLVLVGDGPQRASMMASHRDAVFTGWQRGADLARCYASGDVFLFPSMTETFGNVVLEALASGLALAAYAHGAAQEHVQHEHNGLLAAFGRQDEFIAQALRLATDRQLRARLREAAWRCASALAWEGILQQLERALMATARRDEPPRHAAHPAGARVEPRA